MNDNTSDNDVYVGAVAAANPEYCLTQDEAYGVLRKKYQGQISSRHAAMMRKVFHHPSIASRRIALDQGRSPADICDETPDEKIDRFTRWAVRLSCQAARDVLGKAGLEMREVTSLVLNTCTGYICPGVTSYMIEELGLCSDVHAVDLLGSGCGGAIPNIQTAQRSLVRADDIALSVSVEISSSTFQMGDDSSLVVSNAIFGDGAAAAVLWRRPVGMRIVDAMNLHRPEHREAIRYVHREGQLHNQLAVELPAIVAGPVGTLIRELLGRNGVAIGDVRHWAIHSGGDKVITAVQDELEISDEQIKLTRDVLREYGNMSSATVWFELREIMQNGLEPQDWCVMVAFGAGFSAHACLLRCEDGS